MEQIRDVAYVEYCREKVKNEEEASGVGMSPVCSCPLVNCRAYNPTVQLVSVCCATAWRTQTLSSCTL